MGSMVDSFWVGKPCAQCGTDFWSEASEMGQFSPSLSDHFWNLKEPMYVWMKTPLCPTLCDATDCSPWGSSVHGVLQARIPEWVAISFSRGSSWTRDQPCVSHITGRFFTIEPLYVVTHKLAFSLLNWLERVFPFSPTDLNSLNSREFGWSCKCGQT